MTRPDFIGEGIAPPLEMVTPHSRYQESLKGCEEVIAQSCVCQLQGELRERIEGVSSVGLKFRWQSDVVTISECEQ